MRCTHVVIAAAPEQPAERDPVTCEQRVEPVENGSEQRPSRRCHDPRQSDGAIGLAKDFRPTNDPTIREYAMKYRHEVVVVQSVLARVECIARNVFEGEMTLSVPSLKPSNLKAAVWALAVEKDLELPGAHLHRRSYGG